MPAPGGLGVREGASSTDECTDTAIAALEESSQRSSTSESSLMESRIKRRWYTKRKAAPPRWLQARCLLDDNSLTGSGTSWRADKRLREEWDVTDLACRAP